MTKIPTKPYSILSLIICGQIVVTLLLVFTSTNLRQPLTESRQLRCSCYQSKDDVDRNIFDDGEHDRQNNFTIIGFYESQPVEDLDSWLRSLLFLNLPCKVKLLVNDIQTERYIAGYISEKFVPNCDVSKIEVTTMEMDHTVSSPVYIWRQRFQVLISQLLMDRDVLVVNMTSLWLNDPMSLIWKDYEHFHLWGSGYSRTDYLNMKFLYFKARFLNVRLIGEWKERLVEEAKPISAALESRLNVIVKKYKRTHSFKVNTLENKLFPSATETVDKEWLSDKKPYAYLLFGDNLGRLKSSLDLCGQRFVDSRSGNRSISHIPDPSVAKGIVTTNRESVTILSITNTGFLDFALNWLQSLNILDKEFKVKLLAEDVSALRMLKKIAAKTISHTKIDLHVAMVKNFSSPFPLSSKPLSYFDKAYMDFVNSRPDTLLEELKLGQDVLFVDIDAVWLKDPLSLIWHFYGNFDVFVATGHDRKTPCPCFLYLKSSLVNINMVRDWTLRLKRLAASPWKSRRENDMQALAVILDKYRRKHNLRVQKLNAYHFPTGDFYFKNPTFYDNHKKEVYVVHGNRLGAHRTKLRFFKLFNLWYADIWEYRDHPFMQEHADVKKFKDYS